MLISNRTGQIFIPRESLTSIVIEFAKPLGSYACPDESAIAMRMEGGLKKPVSVTFVGKTSKFTEFYISENDAREDILNMERAYVDQSPSHFVTVFTMCSRGQHDAYDKYVKEYSRIYESIKAAGKSAFADRKKGEIK